MGKRLSVFVSYSHDSIKHKRWVSEFVDLLRAIYGLDVIYDEKADYISQHEEKIMSVDIVVCIVTKKYSSKFDEESELTGVGREAKKIKSRIKENNFKVVEIGFNNELSGEYVRPKLFRDLNVKYINFSKRKDCVDRVALTELIKRLYSYYPQKTGIKPDYQVVFQSALVAIPDYFVIPKGGSLSVLGGSRFRDNIRFADSIDMARRCGEINAQAYELTPWCGTTGSDENNFAQKISRNISHYEANARTLALVSGGGNEASTEKEVIGYTHIIPVNKNIYKMYVGSAIYPGRVLDNVFPGAYICSESETPYCLVLFGLGLVSKDVDLSCGKILVSAVAHHIKYILEAYPSLSKCKLICADDDDTIKMLCLFLGMKNTYRRNADGQDIFETVLCL